MNDCCMKYIDPKGRDKLIHNRQFSYCCPECGSDVMMALVLYDGAKDNEKYNRNIC
jgi:hypothetical protein